MKPLSWCYLATALNLLSSSTLPAKSVYYSIREFKFSHYSIYSHNWTHSPPFRVLAHISERTFFHLKYLLTWASSHHFIYRACTNEWTYILPFIALVHMNNLTLLHLKHLLTWMSSHHSIYSSCCDFIPFHSKHLLIWVTLRLQYESTCSHEWAHTCSILSTCLYVWVYALPSIVLAPMSEKTTLHLKLLLSWVSSHSSIYIWDYAFPFKALAYINELIALYLRHLLICVSLWPSIYSACSHDRSHIPPFIALVHMSDFVFSIWKYLLTCVRSRPSIYSNCSDEWVHTPPFIALAYISEFIPFCLYHLLKWKQSNALKDIILSIKCMRTRPDQKVSTLIFHFVLMWMYK